MSSDFWLGMFTIPAVAWAAATVFAAVSMVIYFSERFHVDTWKIWPKRVEKYGRGSIASTVAHARSVRYFWVPGWHIVMCRTSLVRPGDSLSEHRRIAGIIDRALGDELP